MTNRKHKIRKLLDNRDTLTEELEMNLEAKLRLINAKKVIIKIW